MAENHELRLKIDAAAAQTGSRQFKAAVDAVKQAVRDLERDASGAFAKLQRNIAAASKDKIKGGLIDKQGVRDLEAYAKAQQSVISTATTAVSSAKAVAASMKGLASAYGMASKSGDVLSSSLAKTNSALARQVQLAGQAKAAIRQIGIRTTGSAPIGVGANKAEINSISGALAALQRSYDAVGGAGRRAGDASAKAAREAAAAAKEAARQTAAWQREQRGDQAVARAAGRGVRRAEIDSSRLSGRLTGIGDARSANDVTAAMVRLRAAMDAGGSSTAAVQRIMATYATATQSARLALIDHEKAQNRSNASFKAAAAVKSSAASAARRVEQEIRSITATSNAAAAAMRNATGSMRGLENAFSATFQAGSLFRTMLGSLTFGTFVSSIFQAGNGIEQFTVSMEVATGSVAGAMAEMDYIDSVASRLGTGLSSARDNYSKFAISADLAGVSAAQTQEIFESVSTAMSVLGKGTEDQNLAFLAIEQMMSKGTVSSEELRRQLGERLPGAVNLMAKALKMSVGELQDALKAGEISSADALPKFAKELMQVYGPGLASATKRAGFNLGTLRNEILKFQETVAGSGFMQELAFQFARLTQTLRSGEAASAAKKLGEGLALAARIGGDAILWLVENIDMVGRVVKAVALGIIVRQVGLLASAVVTGTMRITGYTAAWAAHRVGVAAGTATLAGATAAERAYQLAAAKTTATLATKTGGMARLGGAAAGATAIFAGLSRFLGAFVPVIGLVVTGLALASAAFDVFGTSSAGAMSKLDSAVTRSGAKFEDLGDAIAETASRSAFNAIIEDLNTLDTRLDEFKSKHAAERGGLRDSYKSLLGLGVAQTFKATASSTAAAQIGGLGTMDPVDAQGFTYEQRVTQEDASMAAVGLTSDRLANMTNGGKRSYAVLLERLQSAENGASTFSELHQAVAELVMANPIDKDVLQLFADLTKDVRQQEIAETATRDNLVKRYGTDENKKVMGFTDQATEVVKTRDGQKELLEARDALIKEAPATAAAVTTIYTAAIKAAQEGLDHNIFKKNSQDSYDADVDAVDAWRKSVNAAAASVLVDTSAAKTAFEEMLSSEGPSSIFGGGSGLIDTTEIENLRSVWQSFQDSQDVPVAFDQLKRLATDMPASTAAMATFRNEALTLFSQIPAGERTFAAWSQQLDLMKLSYNDPSLDGYIEKMRALGNTTSKPMRAAGQFAEVLDFLGLAATSAGAALIQAAYAQEASAQASSAAAAAAPAFAGGLNSVSSAAYGVSDAVMAAVNALRGFFGIVGGVDAGVNNLVSSMQEKSRIALLTGTAKVVAQMWKDNSEVTAALEKRQADARTLHTSPDSTIRDLGTRALQGVEADKSRVEAAAIQLQKDLEIERNSSKGGSGGGKGGGGGATEASEKATEAALKHLNAMKTERAELELLASGFFKTETAARLYAEAQLAGGGVVSKATEDMIRQAEAAELLNESLRKLAQDPVRDWLDAVPSWVEGARQIEVSALEGLSSSLSDFFATGVFDFQSFAQGIIKSMADVLADQTIKMFLDMMNIDSSLIGKAFGGGGDATDIGAASVQAGSTIGSSMVNAGQQVAAAISTAITGGGTAGTALGGGGGGAAGITAPGSVQAGNSISTAMVSAGQQVATSIRTAITGGASQAGSLIQRGAVVGGQSAAQAQRTAGTVTALNTRRAHATGGQQAATFVQQAHVAGGQTAANAIRVAAPGGGLGGVFSFLGPLLGLFSEGGYSDSPAPSYGRASPAAFRNAPHFAQGTPNTSGIPAILHPNEAVVPLTKGRKIPVDASGMGEGGDVRQTSNTWGDINISIETAGSIEDPKEAAALAGRVAEMVKMQVQMQLAEEAGYGGMMNPRGGR